MPEPGSRPRVVVVGDVIVDVVLAPATELAPGTDVPGRVMLRQGGSATTTARWLGRSGLPVALVGAVGRDAAGCALVRAIRQDGVTTHIAEIADFPTGRVGVFVAPGGERSFVQDRAAALRLAPEFLEEEWFRSAELVHIPTYSLLDHPLGDAGKRAADLAHASGSLVTVDVSSSGPLVSLGRDAAVQVIRGARPDLLFAAGTEARALGTTDDSLLAIAPILVLKRGAGGVTLLWREAQANRTLEVPTRQVDAPDTTGAGDAFDAGFILGWLDARSSDASTAAALLAGAEAGNQMAAAQLARPREELVFG